MKLGFLGGGCYGLAWMIDVTEIRCLDSVDVDVTKLAWRFDEGRRRLGWSLDPEA